MIDFVITLGATSEVPLCAHPFYHAVVRFTRAHEYYAININLPILIFKHFAM